MTIKGVATESGTICVALYGSMIISEIDQS